MPNIYDAIDSLECIYDSNVSMMSDEEAEEFAEALEFVFQFAHKYEPKKELPLEFTCNCGERMIRHDIYGDMSRFFCSKCEAEWLVGPQEV
jgi:hypothetical protein